MQVNNDVGRCEYFDCIQDICERRMSQSCAYEFRCICNYENEWKWFIGKDKKILSKLDELVMSKVKSRENVENVSGEAKSHEVDEEYAEGN